MEKYILSIDSGTTSCRSLLVDMNGQVKAVAQKEFRQIFPESGWVEHNPEEIWETQLSTIHSVLDNAGIEAEQVSAIGITNQRETTVVWDAVSDKPVYNAIVWQDRRTASICEQIKADNLEDYIYENTGLVVDAYFSGTKIKWILDKIKSDQPNVDLENLRFGTIDSWLLWKMTKGKSHKTDYTNASRSLVFNIKSLEWDDKILDYLGIPKTMLPEVKKSADYFGDFELNGHNIPVCGIAGDQQAALFGQACFDPGMAKNTYGTGCFMLMNIGSEFVSSNNGLLTTICCDAKGNPVYALEGSIFIAGAAIQWLRDGLKIITDSAQSESMALASKDNYDVVVVPAFAGLGAPYWDMYARGAIFGLSRGTEQNHLVKATLESLAYQTKDVLSAMEKDAGKSLGVLKVDGGACANNYLMQFQSDILQTDVERPENVETTAMGAAYLAGIYTGQWSADSIKELRKVDKTFNAEMPSEKSERLYKVWQKAVQRSMSWIEK